MRAPIRSQRHDDPAHRPALQRVVARERRSERVRGQDAGQHPHRAAGVAGVEDAAGARKPRRPRPATVTLQTALSIAPTCVDLDAERAEAAQRRRAVAAGGIAVDGVVPSAIAASSAYRCEMDLSPGGRTRPRTRSAGCTITV